MFFGHFLATKKFHKPLYKIDNENTVVSVSVSVSAETENHFRFRYRFRQKRNIAISACFGFGRNKKKPFGRALINMSVKYGKIYCTMQYFICMNVRKNKRFNLGDTYIKRCTKKILKKS